jgi:hypothetical protein
MRTSLRNEKRILPSVIVLGISPIYRLSEKGVQTLVWQNQAKAGLSSQNIYLTNYRPSEKSKLSGLKGFKNLSGL